MVLQRGRPIAIWGTASPGEMVNVWLPGEHAFCQADAQGRWSVEVGPFEAGGPFDIEIGGRERVALRDVLVGEVWLCSGQSNMEWPVHRSSDPDAEIAAANYPRIRLFVVPHAVSGEPKSDGGGEWVACTPETVADFSAVAYSFGRDVLDSLDVPVGLVQSARSGTPAEAWTSAAALEGRPEFAPILERWAKAIAEYPEAMKRHEEEVALWKEAAAQARAEGKPEPRAPSTPYGPDHPHRPSGLWNAMVAPLVPFAIRGVLWYQGESNASRAEQYRSLFPTLIRAWRAAWKDEALPFLFVQLASFRVGTPEQGLAWAELRDAQREALALPATGMAVTVDIGDPADIHPKNKREVGRRLALLARSRVYGKSGVDSGPLYRSMETEGSALRLRFDHVGGGLVAGKEGLVGFEVAGEDRAFVAATATIEGDAVVLRAEGVARPVAARFAWSDCPTASLFNREGLPASPFRTDDGPGTTAQAR
jgi:sialate O-acetylesterase